MAIRPEDEYGSRAVPANADYPHGSAQNETVDGANDGTPYEERWRNDVWGFLQALLKRGGVPPSGNPDTVLASDYLEAMLNVQGPKWQAMEDLGTADATLDVTSVTALSATRVALYDDGPNELVAYDFDGTNWAQVGNRLLISGVDKKLLSAVSATRVVVLNSDLNALQMYDFDGTNWTTSGNASGSVGVGNLAVAALSATRVAVADSSAETIAAYDFDGTNWAQVAGSNTFSVAGAANPALAGVSGDTVIFGDTGAADLFFAVQFDGVDWVQLTPTVAGVRARSISAIDGADFIVSDDATGGVDFYRFSGSDLAKVADGIASPAETVAVLTRELAATGLTGGDQKLQAVSLVRFSPGTPYSVAGGAF